MKGEHKDISELTSKFDETRSTKVNPSNELLHAAYSLNKSVIKKALRKHEVNERLTKSQIPLWSIMMGVAGKSFDSEDKKKEYYSVLSAVKKHGPDFQAVDKFGRNCLHHAGAADNIHGI